MTQVDVARKARFQCLRKQQRCLVPSACIGVRGGEGAARSGASSSSVRALRPPGGAPVCAAGQLAAQKLAWRRSGHVKFHKAHEASLSG